ncbi:MAG: SDR family NAD(P)-dependent oxidoreductase [Gammaproteobacteria bacterium]|nr:MAG: SDR family NAD(P)-dependent oxidoreductase [Gammaproteobacteria bacterium]
MTALARTIWITGGGSGIGLALARRWSREGATLILSGRDEARLQQAVEELEGPAHALPVDVTGSAPVAAAVSLIRERHGVPEMAVLNAGIYRPSTRLSAERIEAHLQTNLLGVVRCLEALLPGMRERGSGQVILMGSPAGYLGLPGATGYGASKAALLNLAEALWPELRRAGIDLRLVSPGFVDTPMVARNRFPMPFLMSADEAARRIIRGLEGRAFEIAFPRRLIWPLKALRCLPAGLRVRILNLLAGHQRD